MAVIAINLGVAVKMVTDDPPVQPEPKVSTLELTPVPVLEVWPVATPTTTPPGKRNAGNRPSTFVRSQKKVASLERIAQCESKGSYTAKNPSSSASGKYQILDSTWRGTSPGKLKDEEGKYVYPSARSAPPAQQDTAANELWNNGKGASHWRACL